MGLHFQSRLNLSNRVIVCEKISNIAGKCVVSSDKKVKCRLDYFVQQQHPDLSRTIIQSLIMQGKVSVDGVVRTKPGTPVAATADIDVDVQKPKYVSRAGFKLEHALETFGIDPIGLVCLDAGLSTGGFTDCLLQRGAVRVYGIDVGTNQVREKIRADKRVVVMEQTNLRYVTSLPELVDLVTLDLSFISLLTVMPAVVQQLKPNGRVICLIKPQFEAERHEVRRGGVITDSAVHKRVIQKIVDGCAMLGLQLQEAPIESSLKGATSGNKEFLAVFKRM